jgi:hypothetical protein
MKRTDIERRDRDIKRTRKKEEVLQRKSHKNPDMTVGDFINEFYSLFFYDEKQIYNLKDDVRILELFEQMKEQIPDKQWENVFRKAIRKTQVKERDKAFTELKTLLGF